MYSNRLFTPLRYPGGKAAFAPFITSVMEENGLHGGSYMEPYAGGAGVALDLLFSGTARHIHINDADPAVYCFWNAVKQDPEGMLRLLRDTPITMEEWLRWRDVLRGTTEASSLELGFATLFMNRTNRSGILKGGVIGGLKQDGSYKLDARFKKDVIAGRINRIALNSESISVYCEDAMTILSRAKELIDGKGLIYLDPPYYVKGKGLYRNYYSDQDHQSIASLVQGKGFTTPWVVSYDNVEPIHRMYAGSASLVYGLNYTAHRKYRASECVFLSRKLKPPALDRSTAA